MWSLGRGLVAIQLCFLHIEEKRLADFCAGEKSKMNRRYSKNSLYARSLYAGGATNKLCQQSNKILILLTQFN